MKLICNEYKTLTIWLLFQLIPKLLKFTFRFSIRETLVILSPDFKIPSIVMKTNMSDTNLKLLIQWFHFCHFCHNITEDALVISRFEYWMKRRIVCFDLSTIFEALVKTNCFAGPGIRVLTSTLPQKRKYKKQISSLLS